MQFGIIDGGEREGDIGRPENILRGLPDQRCGRIEHPVCPAIFGAGPALVYYAGGNQADRSARQVDPMPAVVGKRLATFLDDPDGKLVVKMSFETMVSILRP
ncbi:hypothetical protein BSY16_5731 (plasmid) [Sinorhizobium sp. RAC02]|nr:hypothetical protein BSY16_5731 [Sinorhizobium sp. RAC02]